MVSRGLPHQWDFKSDTWRIQIYIYICISINVYTIFVDTFIYIYLYNTIYEERNGKTFHKIHFPIKSSEPYLSRSSMRV